jgi:1-acyl-sn-glycerol-3-phosphate acyltransferase
MGTTFVGAKAELFKNPILRRIIDNLGAVPVFRSKDEGKSTEQRMAGGTFLNTAIKKIRNKENMAIFPGGERSKDPLLVADLFDGVGKIVCKVAREESDEQPRILPVGIFYLDKEHTQAYLHVGEMSDEKFESPEAVMEWLQPSMQGALDTAVGHAEADLMAQVLMSGVDYTTHEYALR